MLVNSPPASWGASVAQILVTFTTRTCFAAPKDAACHPTLRFIPASKLAGSSGVFYEERKDTFGDSATTVISYKLSYHDGKQEMLSGDVLDTPFALDGREGRVDRIEVVLC